MEQKEKNRIILDWIIKAKDVYVNTIINCGMCKAFKIAMDKRIRIREVFDLYPTGYGT
jgi:hypothetical protein